MDNNESEQLKKSKAAKTRKIGIILLIAIGIPLLLVGACILIVSNGG